MPAVEVVCAGQSDDATHIGVSLGKLSVAKTKCGVAGPSFRTLSACAPVDQHDYRRDRNQHENAQNVDEPRLRNSRSVQ